MVAALTVATVWMEYGTVTDEVLITIIGAGAVGCAIANEISGAVDGDIVVIEKNSQVNGENQSSRNSGVIHAGIYYPKDLGPLKARLCVDGNRLLYEFCQANSVPFARCGKLVVATDELEEEYLEDIRRIAEENEVPDIELIDKSRIKDLEPNISGKSALYVPTSGIVEATSFINALYRRAENKGVIFLTSNTVIDIIPDEPGGGFELSLMSLNRTEKFRTRILINSAGLFSDEIARMINPASPYIIDPVKGESAKFYSLKRDDINLSGISIYPVPFGYLPNGERLRVPFGQFLKLFKENKVTKSVGVHISPSFDFSGGRYITGNTFIVGPAYSKPQNKEDYKPFRELSYYLEKVAPFFPGLMTGDLIMHQAGIRAKLKDGYDFIIERDRCFPDCINLAGIDSPGLTSSLAIAGFVKKMVKEML
jgi:L-2-hydroxyglutarate oxidase LhgO